MTVEEQNKAVIHRLIQAYNERDREVFDASYADPVVVRGQDGDRELTHEEHWAEVQAVWRVFPDHEATLIRMIAEGDRVFLYWTYSGTHLGKGSRGIEPTGRRAEWRAFSDYRLEDGKIVEGSQVHDTLTMYLKLGLIELPGS